MKVFYENEEIINFSETKKKVIKNDISDDIFDEDIKRRLNWVVEHKYEQSLKRLKDEWMPKLKERYESIPTNDDALAELIFSQQDYKDKKVKDEEQKVKLN